MTVRLRTIAIKDPYVSHTPLIFVKNGVDIIFLFLFSLYFTLLYFILFYFILFYFILFYFILI